MRKKQRLVLYTRQRREEGMNLHFQEEKSVPTPALIYYQDVILDNTRKAIDIAGGAKYLWPHVKSHKSAEIVEMQCKMGIHRFKCATIAEAAMTAGTSATDILLAYPLVGPNIRRFLLLMQEYQNKNFYALFDCLDQARLLSEKVVNEYGNKRLVNVMVDVNTGMNRTGVTFDKVMDFCRELEKLPGLKFCGFHCYDGDRHEKRLDDRKKKVGETLQKVKNMCETLAGEGIDFEYLILGGSPSFPCYAEGKGIVPGKQCFYSPGTVFIYDAGYKAQFPDLPFEPGAAVLSRVVSHPCEGYFTLDTGYKAIAAEQGVRGILPEYPNAEEQFQSEEHWTFKMKPGHESERPEVGQEVYIIPWHICPTTALYDRILVVGGSHREAVWNVTARNRELLV